MACGRGRARLPAARADAGVHRSSPAPSPPWPARGSRAASTSGRAGRARRRARVGLAQRTLNTQGRVMLGTAAPPRGARGRAASARARASRSARFLGRAQTPPRMAPAAPNSPASAARRSPCAVFLPGGRRRGRGRGLRRRGRGLGRRICLWFWRRLGRRSRSLGGRLRRGSLGRQRGAGLRRRDHLLELLELLVGRAAAPSVPLSVRSSTTTNSS